jgi:hypothetical protein
LDGVDELSMSGERLHESLRELRRVTKDGGRIALSSRMGHLSSVSAIPAHFGPAEIATIAPMPPADGHELLVKHGATSIRADEVLSALQGSPAQGIPLFLLIAYFLGVKHLDRETLKSRTKVLLELLRLFCERDEPRLGVPVDEQMRLLTEFAHWSSLMGEELTEPLALEHLGIDAEEPDAVMIFNPHALLTRTSDSKIVFKYPQFSSLFTAKALCEDWQRLGFGSVTEDFRATKLDDATVEHLARLISGDLITAAWAGSPKDSEFSRYPLVRRNLLAITLARLEDDAEAASHQMRADRLAALLGRREISDVLFSDLVIQRLDLRDWKIKRLKGRGGSISYCVNLDFCDYDDTVLAQNLDGTNTSKSTNEPATLHLGITRLREMLKPLRRRGLPGLIRVVTFEEAKDPRGWAELGRYGFALQKKKLYGERAWTLNETKHGILSRFVETDSETAALATIQQDPEMKSLVLSLGKGK